MFGRSLQATDGNDVKVQESSGRGIFGVQPLRRHEGCFWREVADFKSIIRPSAWALICRSALLVCLAVGCRAATPDEDWLPVTPQDLQKQDVPGDPGASAVLLYYANVINDRDHTEFTYRRIKVLTDKGKSYGNIEIAVYPGMEIVEFSARTVQPDGTLSDVFTQPFEKVLVKARGVKILAKVFTLPDVTPGCIVEYKYKWHSKQFYWPEWLLEHELFAVKEHFRLDYPPDWEASFQIIGSQAQPVVTKGAFELDLQNVPAFRAEEQMPPEVNYKAAVRFSYGARWAAGSFWAVRASHWSAGYEEFLGHHKEIQSAAEEAIGALTDPEEKLKRLYARAQGIRNLSFENQRTQDEDKKEQLKPNKNVLEVLKHGYGDRADINILFVALARAAGFDASVMLVASRERKLFQQDYLNASQYNSVLATVRVNNVQRYFDPGTRLCPFGQLRWMYTWTAAVKLQAFGGLYFNLTDTDQDSASQVRLANLVLSEDGSATGKITVTYEQREALEHRLLALKTDETGRKKELEDDLKLWLPSGSTVSITDSQGWDRPDSPLLANFQVTIPNYATAAGRRLLLPSSLFLARQKGTFQHAERKYPIYFHYPFSEVDTVVVQIPDGVTVEGSPEPQDVKPSFGRYTSANKIVDQKVISSRSLTMTKFFFEPKMYAELKDFFGKVQGGDEGRTVLRLSRAADGQ